MCRGVVCTALLVPSLCYRFVINAYAQICYKSAEDGHSNINRLIITCYRHMDNDFCRGEVEDRWGPLVKEHVIGGGRDHNRTAFETDSSDLHLLVRYREAPLSCRDTSSVVWTRMYVLLDIIKLHSV